MGIVNVTPDSFSDGGRFDHPDAAVTRALQLVDEGADIIDIGGESTRPGFAPISAVEELHRVMPVIERLVPQCRVPVSIDTTKPDVARAALSEGASIINDQAGLIDDNMLRVAADTGASVIAMHNRRSPESGDVVADLIDSFSRMLARADAAGVERRRVIIDPGFGFGKTHAQNLEVLRRLGELRVLARPILIGTSRKSMIGKVLTDTTPEQRLEGTAATVAIGIAFGADIVRVHDVAPMVKVARMSDAIVRHHYVPATTT